MCGEAASWHLWGTILETYWGPKRFLLFYMVAGIGASLFNIGIDLLLNNPGFGYMMGASGAIYGILLAYGWLFPNRLIYIYFLFPIPAKYLVIIYGLLELYSSMEGTGGGIAHLTHLGGLLFGLIYMGYPYIRQKIRRQYYKRKWPQRGPNDKGCYH